MSGSDFFFGIVVPGSVFLIALFLTLWLYKKFSPKTPDED